MKRYAAVTAEQDEWGICYALGLKADSEKLPGRSMEPVQCALQLLSALTQASPKGLMPIMLIDRQATAQITYPQSS